VDGGPNRRNKAAFSYFTGVFNIDWKGVATGERDVSFIKRSTNLASKTLMCKNVSTVFSLIVADCIQHLLYKLVNIFRNIWAAVILP